MKKILTVGYLLFILTALIGQGHIERGDSLKKEGLLVPALELYSQSFSKNPSSDVSYKIASTCALLWTSQMRDTAFYYLNHAMMGDSTLEVLYDPQFLSLIEDLRWVRIENDQIKKYEAKNKPIEHPGFARELFRMIIRDQGYMYAGNIERKKYMRNGGHFSTPAIFPILAMEEENLRKNEARLLQLLDIYGWPTASAVTEYAAAGAALVINHTSYELRSKYFPMLEAAFKKGEAQPLRYAKMRDRLLVEEGKEQLYGTQIKFENMQRGPHPIKAPKLVDKRRRAIGLGPLGEYLKARFGIDWEAR